MAAAVPTGAEADVDPKAGEVLRKCADFHSANKYLNCALAFRMSVQATGTRREIWASYNIAIERPNKVALNLTDGIGATIITNGKKMTTYVPAMNKYSIKNSPATLDQFFDSEEVGLVNRSLGEMMFLGRLVKADPYESMLSGATKVGYVGLDDFDGGKAHHLKFSRADIDWHMWIDDGDKPFLRKLSPDVSPALLAQVEGGKDTKMDLTLKFDKWSIVAPAKDAFVFLPPQDAVQVAALFEPNAEEEDGKSELVGKPPPATKLQLLDGENIDLADYKGKSVVVLDFWATWCAPCLQSLPIASGVAKDYADKGVVFLTVNFNEDVEKIKAFLEKKGYDFKVALDKGGELAKQYSIKGIPFTVIIGKDGNILHVHAGMQPDLKDILSKELEAAVKGEPLGLPTSAEQWAK